MKTIVVTLLLSTVVSQAYAKVSFDWNINFKSKISFWGTKKYHGTNGWEICYVDVPPDEPIPLSVGWYDSNNNGGTIELDSEASKEVFSTHSFRSVSGHPHFSAREITTSIKDKIDSHGTFHFEVSFQEAYHSGRDWQTPKGCTETFYYSRNVGDEVEGYLELNFDVPKDTYVAEIDVVDRTNDFASAILSTENSLVELESKGIAKLNNRRVWVRPGESMKYRIDLSGRDNLGRGISGKLALSVKFIGISKFKELDQAQPAYNILELVEKRITCFNSLGDGKDNDEFCKNKNLTDLFVNLGFFSLNDPEGIRRQIKAQPVQDTQLLLKKLRRLANADLKELGTDRAWEIKAASSVILYLISSELISELSQFCATVEMNLPFLDRTISIKGHNAAFFFIGRALMRLEATMNRVKENGRNNYFPNDPILRFLENVSPYNGRTFMEIAGNKKVLKSISSAYLLIMDGMDLEKPPTIRAANDFDFVLSKLGHVPTMSVHIHPLLEKLNELAKSEQLFLTELRTFAEKFGNRSRESIDAINLISKRKRHFAELGQLLDEIRDQASFFDFSNVEDGDLRGVFLDNLSNNISLFKSPLKVERFEKVRAYISERFKTAELVERAKQCLN